MRPILALLLLACSGAAPAPPVAAATPAGLAPRPFTAEQIRAGMPVGRELRYRIEEQGKPSAVMRIRVTAADAETMTATTEILDNEDHLISNEGSKTSRWDELVQHANFPADKTQRVEGTIQVPAGTFASIDYKVTGDGGISTIYRFAKELPGPPILMVVEKEGLIVSSMTLLSRK